jgi:hypothetical protein
MLDTHMMKCTDNRPLQEAPDAFNGVGVNLSPDIFILGVIDGFMPGVMVSNASVGRPFLGEDRYRFRGDVLQGDFVEGLAGPVSSDLEYDFPTTLHDSHQSLVTLVASTPPFSFATYKCFVHFDDAGHQDSFFAKR